ncbi:MAG: PorV/PorQ family protein [candidate division Zixibacteria bacterium]|nr:PorV/PorQ family protein [candidate division Zixibacteria bacterium]
MKKLLLIVMLLLVLAPGYLYGQAKVGTAGAQFLEIGVSARAVGMGEAFISMTDDATAVYYNPSGLTYVYEKQFMFTHIEYAADINYEFGGFVLPMWDLGGVFGFGVYMLDAGSVDETTYEHTEGTGRTFGAKEYALSASYARNLTDHFSVGATLKVIDQVYEEMRSTGWGADVGTTYDTGYRGFRISMVISNFGPDMTFISEAHPLPINFKFGASFNVLESDLHRLTLAAEGAHPADNEEKYTTGMEYTYKEMFSLRMGQKFQIDTGGFSAGAGVRLPVNNWTLTADYAFFDFGVLESVHRFTFGFAF